MFSGKNRFRSWLILTLFVALFGAVAAYAVELEEYGAKYLLNDDPSLVDVDIIDFKVTLNELGFYSAGVSESTLQTRELDDLTMAAVKLVCKYNPDLIYYNDGVSNVLYWRVMGLTEGELNTPLDEVYLDIAPGTESDMVAKIQNRLNQLGYDAAGYTFEPGVYDDSLQGAIDAFVECNKFVYNRNSGITAEMQELLFSDAAVIYVAPEITSEPVSFPDNIFSYFMTPVNVFGLEIPNVALWMAGFVLLCVIVALILNLTASGGDKKKKPARTTGDSRDPQKIKTGEIEFTVEYGDEIYIHRNNMNEYVRIGRATGNFPLNTTDESVSRKHCEIYHVNGNLMLRDFSSYGTKINGEMCYHSQHVLHSGDILDIGKHKITIRFQK